MAGERKIKQPLEASEAMEAARQAYLKENVPKHDSILSLNKEKSEENLEAKKEFEDVSENEGKQEEKQEITPKKEVEERQESAVEREARELGWVPEEEFKGDSSKWRTAQSWIDNTRISRELSEVKRTSRELLDYLKNKDKVAAESIITELKIKKRDAIASADVEMVEKIEAQIDSLMQNKPVVSEENKNPQEVDEFLRKNDWFFHNEDMKQFAIDAENRYKRLHPSMSLSERLKKVEQDTLRFYGKEEKQNIAPVEAKRAPAPRDTMPRYDEVEDLVKRIIDHKIKKSEFEVKYKKRSKPMTREEYIAQLYRAGTIDKYGKLISN